MNEEEKILVEKIAFLRYELAKCADTMQKFSLKKQIEEDEKRLQEIRNQKTENYILPSKKTTTMEDKNIEDLKIILKAKHPKIVKLLDKTTSKVISHGYGDSDYNAEIASFKIIFTNLENKAKLNEIKDSKDIILKAAREVIPPQNDGYDITEVIYDKENETKNSTLPKPNSNHNYMKKDLPKSPQEKKVSQRILLFLGVGFTLLSFIIAFIFSDPKPIQHLAIRIVFALGGGFLGGFMTGFLEIQISWLKAAGGLALGIVFYFWNPAQITTNYQIKGTVFIDNKTQEGVTVKLQQAQRDDKTNSYGIFEMKVNQNDLKSELDFTFIYSQLYIDTILTIEKDKVDLTNLKFYLLEGKKPVVEIIEESKQKSNNEITFSKPKVNYHSVTLQGDYSMVDYVLFDNNESNKIQPKNGIVKLPNLGTEDKNVKIYFKDTSKQEYDLDVNNQTRDIPIL